MVKTVPSPKYMPLCFAAFAFTLIHPKHQKLCSDSLQRHSSVLKDGYFCFPESLTGCTILSIISCSFSALWEMASDGGQHRMTKVYKARDVGCSFVGVMSKHPEHLSLFQKEGVSSIICRTVSSYAIEWVHHPHTVQCILRQRFLKVLNPFLLAVVSCVSRMQPTV